MTRVVTDRATGAPLANARVFFYGSAYGTAFTDGSGRYTFYISDLNQFGGAISGNLYVGATGYFEAPVLSVTDLSAQPSLPLVNDVTLLPGGTLIQGTVIDASTGLGVAGATVQFNRNPMSTFRGGATTESVTTDGDGHYTIDSSYFNEVTGDMGPPGVYSASLMVNAPGYVGANGSASFTLMSFPVAQDFSLTPGS